jgi:hypothetical protein
MGKRDRDSSSQQLSYREKRRSVAHLYNNKFSATLYLKTVKGGKRATRNKSKTSSGRFNSKQCFGVQRKTAFALPSSIFLSQ